MTIYKLIASPKIIKNNFITKVIQNPVSEYLRLHNKIISNPLTSIPDLKYTVDYLIKEMNNPFVLSSYKLDKKIRQMD